MLVIKALFKANERNSKISNNDAQKNGPLRDPFLLILLFDSVKNQIVKQNLNLDVVTDG